MVKSYLSNTHKRKTIAENVIFHNLYMSKYVQSKANLQNIFFKKQTLQQATLQHKKNFKYQRISRLRTLWQKMLK